MFLVALYECSENHELENPDLDRMYCSNHNWIGERPHCYSLGGEEEGEVEGEGLSSCYSPMSAIRLTLVTLR